MEYQVKQITEPAKPKKRRNTKRRKSKRKTQKQYKIVATYKKAKVSGNKLLILLGIPTTIKVLSKK